MSKYYPKYEERSCSRCGGAGRVMVKVGLVDVFGNPPKTSAQVSEEARRERVNVFELVAVHKMSYAQIARDKGVTPATIRSKYQRCIREWGCEKYDHRR